MTKRRLHPNDVSIGLGRSLQWVDFPGNLPKSALQDVDAWLADLAGLWDSLETKCVHECCGIDAFDLWPDSVRSAVPAARRPEVLGQLGVLRDRIASLPAGGVVVSCRLNQLLHRDLVLGIVDHLVDTLQARDRPDAT